MLPLLAGQRARGAVYRPLIEILFMIIRDDIVAMLEIVFDGAITLQCCLGKLGLGVLLLGARFDLFGVALDRVGVETRNKAAENSAEERLGLLTGVCTRSRAVGAVSVLW